MIAECYSADVYCDLEGHAYGDAGSCHNPAVFTGPSKRETDRQRRRSGWIRVKGQDVCPECAKRLRDLRKAGVTP